MSSELEQSFAQLAYAYLQDNIPEMYPFLIGFQLVDSDETKKRNLGMFAFNVHGKYYSMPVFFINGFIKPLVHILDMKTKKFTAATPDNIRMLTKPQTEPGVSLTDKDKHKQLYSNPNIANFTISPVLSKIGSYTGPDISKVHDYLIEQPMKEPIEHKFEERLKVASVQVKKAFAKSLIKDRDFLRKIATQYPRITEVIKEATEVMPHGYVEKDDFVAIESEPRTDLTIAQNEDIYLKGYSIQDERGETSTVAPIQLNSTEPFGGTTKNGMYRVLLSGGLQKDVLVLRNPQEFTDKGTRAEELENDHVPSKDLMICLDTKECCICDHKDVLALHIHSKHGEENYWPDIWDKTIPASKCKVGKKYVFILPSAERMFSGNCTVPVKIKSKVINSNKLYTYYVEPELNQTLMDNKITIQPRGRDHITVIDNYEYLTEDGPQGEMLITPDVRAMEVVSKYPSKMRLGNCHDLMSLWYDKGFEQLDVDNVPYLTDVFKIRSGDTVKEGGYVDSLKYLVIDKGMSEEDACECLRKKGSYIVKEATSIQTYDEPYYEVNTNILPSDQEKEYETVKLNDMIKSKNTMKRNPLQNLGTIIPGKLTPEMDIYLAQMAAKNGDPDVIDTSLLASLSKYKNNVEEVKEDIPIFMKAVHRLGMLLYRLWWHIDEFKDMFTTDELYELEQNTLELFKNMNNLALTLQYKTRLGYVDV